MTVNVKTNNNTKVLVEKNQKVSISMEKLWSGTARDWEVDITLSKAPNNFSALVFESDEDTTVKNIIWLTNSYSSNEQLIGTSFMKSRKWIVMMNSSYVNSKTIKVASQYFDSPTISTCARLIAVYGLNFVV